MTTDVPKGLRANIVYLMLSGLVLLCWAVVGIKTGLATAFACCSQYGCSYRTGCEKRVLFCDCGDTGPVEEVAETVCVKED